MMIDRVLSAAKPYLINSTVTDAVLGLSLIAIELDSKDLGLSYMFRDQLPGGCSSLGFAQELIGMNAYQTAKLSKDGKNDAERAVGLAVLTAGSRRLNLPNDIDDHPLFGLDVKEDDVVGMIGLIPPIAKQFSQRTKELIIFDKGASASCCAGMGADLIKPMEMQSELLPRCDLVIISGTTIINRTIDKLLDWCLNAREIVMVGASTPMYPEAFRDTNVTVLAGSWWDNRYKDEIFKKISLAGGIKHVNKTMIKKVVRVR